MKALLKMFKWILGTLFVVLLLAVGAIGVLVALEIRVQLDPLRAPVEAASEAALGREISFDGDMVLVPTLWPTLEVADVSVANPPQWPEGVFASAGTVRLQLGVAPLLSGEIQIADITAKDVALNLESNAKGEPNWEFSSPEPSEEQSEKPRTEGEVPAIRFTALQNLTLEDIELNYTDQQIGKKLAFALDRLQGTIPEGQSIKLGFSGSLQDKPFQFDLEAGSLEQLAQGQDSWPLSLSGDLSGAPLTAEGNYVRGTEPEISASLSLGSLDFGALLAWLGIMEGLEAAADAVTASTIIRGDSLAELITTSEIEFSLQGGAWTLVHPGTGNRLNLGIEEGTISVLPDEPVTLSLDARIDKVPLVMGITGPSLAELMTPDTALPLELSIAGGGADMTLTTDIVRPMEGQGLVFDMKLAGSRLNAMNALLKADLPPLGPCELSGTLGLNQQGFTVKSLLVTVANTSLSGNLDLNIATKPPSLDVDLRSKRLQIDDFRVEGWSPTKGATKSDEVAATETEATQPSTDGSPPLLSRETLSSLNAKISVAVDDVRYGNESLGRGSLLISLDDARLSLDPLEVELPGGGAEVRFLFHPRESDTEMALTAKVEEFDYGVLARQIDPDSEIGGKLALDVDVSARADSPEKLLQEGEGHFDFGLWPEQMKADLFELWAVNVISALLSEMDKDESSKVNCVIARFRLQDGVMNNRVIFADTTKMRIEGSAKVDFRQRTLDVEAGPKAKKPELFSLAVPVGLSGKFDDFGIDINPVVLTGKTVSFLTSPLHVPLRRIFVKGEPADGEAACAEVWAVRGDAGPTVGGGEAAAREAEPDDAESMEPKSNGEEQDSKDDSSSAFGRLKDKIKDAVDESPDAGPAIDVLNLNE